MMHWSFPWLQFLFYYHEQMGEWVEGFWFKYRLLYQSSDNNEEISKLLNTFEELAKKVIKDVPELSKSVYVACDTYPELSIKNAERKNRGESDKIPLKSSNIKIPRDFQRFLDNGNNKTRLFELFVETYIARKNDLIKLFISLVKALWL